MKFSRGDPGLPEAWRPALQLGFVRVRSKVALEGKEAGSRKDNVG